MVCQLANWFTIYASTRTYTSSLEAALTVAALAQWPSLSPRPASTGSRAWALVLAAVACVVRPTSAILWVFLGLSELASCSDPVRFILLQVLPIGSVGP